MKTLKANNSKQLDICLRFLYAENQKFIVDICKSDKGKIFYTITVVADEQTFTQLEEKFRILIS